MIIWPLHTVPHSSFLPSSQALCTPISSIAFLPFLTEAPAGSTPLLVPLPSIDLPNTFHLFLFARLIALSCSLSFSTAVFHSQGPRRISHLGCISPQPPSSHHPTPVPAVLHLHSQHQQFTQSPQHASHFSLFIPFLSPSNF